MGDLERPARGLAGVAALATATALTATYLVRLAAPGPASPETDAILLSGAFLAGGVGAVLRARRAGWRPGDVVLALGLVSYALGWVYWARFVLPVADPAYPSPADGLWLLLYPGLVIALALKADPGRRFRLPFWIDVLIGTTGAASAIVAFVVPRLIGEADPRHVIGVNAIYLGADAVVLLLSVSVVFVRRLRAPAHLWTRVAAVAVLAVTDAYFLLDVAETGVVPSSSVMNAGWLIAFLLLVGTIGWHAPLTVTTRGRGRSVLLVPLAGTIGALGVLVHAPEDVAVAHFVAATTVLLAVARMGLAFLEVDALAGSRELALTDELTGLANRRGFYEAAREHLASGRPATLLLLDLDGFKEVNDSLGHGAGDVLLQLVAGKLCGVARRRTESRTADVVARLGGDEFAVLLPGATHTAGLDAAERLVNALATSYDVDGIRVRVSASGGIVQSPDQGSDLDELLRRADVAMYRAKAAKGGATHAVAYRPELDTRTRDGLRRAERMRTALADDRLVLHYQPKVDLLSGRITGVEVLARVEDPEGGLLVPGVFLGALSQDGQLADLTARVLDGALAQVRTWADAGRLLPVAVNVPSDGFLEGDLPAMVSSALARHGVRPSMLCLEMTEEVLLHDHLAASEILTELRATGVRVSIDDYGTGYSSLAYLRDLPLDEIKLDRSFVAAMVGDPRAARIVESTVGLAHALDLRVVAEGVESDVHRRALAASGCDEAQGFFFARPVRAEALDELLAVWDRTNGGRPLGVVPTQRQAVMAGGD